MSRTPCSVLLLLKPAAAIDQCCAWNTGLPVLLPSLPAYAAASHNCYTDGNFCGCSSCSVCCSLPRCSQCALLPAEAEAAQHAHGERQCWTALVTSIRLTITCHHRWHTGSGVCNLYNHCPDMACAHTFYRPVDNQGHGLRDPMLLRSIVLHAQLAILAVGCVNVTACIMPC